MDSKLKQRITDTLRKVRQERRWTQAELAEKLGLSQSRLSEIEHGKGSLTAEQFITLLKLFNLPISHFIKTKSDNSEAQLQKALARLGGTQLKEDPNVLPSEKLNDAYNVILETVIGGSPRLLTALTPVIILHAHPPLFRKIINKLKEYRLENRFYWVLNGVSRVIDRRFKTHVPHNKRFIYRRAKTILEEMLNWQTMIASEYEEDRLDAGIVSEKTFHQLRESRDALALVWKVVTRIREEDFYNALLESEKND
ncbi:MAG: helix-turn-helix transcriptional regulator [Deltaproteobacteria bacterium]|nr:helix-turn-helix transcriptional regulator [Deltaproteobacteria bacterium]